MMAFLASRLGGWAVGGLVAVALFAYIMVLRADNRALEAEAKQDAQTIKLQAAANQTNIETIDALRTSMKESADAFQQSIALHNRLLVERDKQNAHLEKMAGAKSHAAKERPEVLERRIRRNLNIWMQRVARETCSSCGDEDGEASPEPGAGTGPGS